MKQNVSQKSRKHLTKGTLKTSRRLESIKGSYSTEFNHKKISLQGNRHSVNEYAKNNIREKCTCRTACWYGLDAINVNFMQQIWKWAWSTHDSCTQEYSSTDGTTSSWGKNVLDHIAYLNCLPNRIIIIIMRCLLCMARWVSFATFHKPFFCCVPWSDGRSLVLVEFCSELTQMSL